MPTLPHYDRRVGIAPLPTPFRGSPGDNGMGAIGEGLKQVGGTGMAIAEDISVNKGIDALTRYQDVGNEVIPAFKQTIGDEAAKAAKPTTDTLTDKREEIAKALEADDPVAANVFRARSNSLLAEWQRGINEHVGQQKVVADDSRRGAFFQAKYRAADDPNATVAELDHMSVDGESIAHINQASDEAGNATYVGYKGTLYKRAIEARLAHLDDPRKGQQYLDEAHALVLLHRADLGADANDLEEKVTKAVAGRVASANADALVNTFIDPVTGNERADKDGQTAAQVIQEIKDPNQRTLTATYYAQAKERFKGDFDQGNTNLFGDINKTFNDVLMRTKSPWKAREQATAAMGPELRRLNERDSVKYTALQRLWQEQIDAAKARSEAHQTTPDEAKAMFQLYNDIQNHDPSVMKMDGNGWLIRSMQLAPKDREPMLRALMGERGQMVDAQGRAIAAAGKNAKDAAYDVLFNMAKSQFGEKSTNAAKWTPEHREQLLKAKENVDRAVDQFQAFPGNNGSAPDFMQVRQWSDEAIGQKGHIIGSGVGAGLPGGPYFETSTTRAGAELQGQLGLYRPPEIDNKVLRADAKARLEAAQHRAGNPQAVTDEDVTNFMLYERDNTRLPPGAKPPPPPPEKPGIDLSGPMDIGAASRNLVDLYDTSEAVEPEPPPAPEPVDTGGVGAQPALKDLTLK